MNRIAFYVLLILIYLGLAKSFSSNELGIAYIKNAQSLSSIATGNNVTAILIDMHATGFIIKTYYQKYRLVYPFEKSKEIIVRVSRRFAIECKEYIGLSLFRRLEKDGFENTTPLPPGALFVGNPSFGRWKLLNSGEQGWFFFNAYSSLPAQLGWQDFQPTSGFMDVVQNHLGQNKVFFGLKGEFGTQGEISQKAFPNYFNRQKKPKKNFKELTVEYFKNNFYSK